MADGREIERQAPSAMAIIKRLRDGPIGDGRFDLDSSIPRHKPSAYVKSYCSACGRVFLQKVNRPVLFKTCSKACSREYNNGRFKDESMRQFVARLIQERGGMEP
jgi:hypothetical protein